MPSLADVDADFITFKKKLKKYKKINKTAETAKTMAATGKALQLVKPHVKRISFPSRSGVLPKWSGQNVAPAAAAAPAAVSAAPPAMTLKSSTPIAFAGDSLPAPPWPQVGSLPRGGGVAYADLPAKYRRRTVSDAEIDAILSGGAP